MMQEFKDIRKRTDFKKIREAGLALCFSCGDKVNKSEISTHQLA